MNENNENTTAVTAETGKTGHGGKARIIALAVAVVLLLAGVVGGWQWSRHRIAVAAQACSENAATLRVEADKYRKLLKGDAAVAMKTTTGQVKDAKTVTALASQSKAKTPATPECPAGDRTGLEASAARMTSDAAWYRTHTKSLTSAVKAVDESRVDKTVDQAKKLLNDSEGKVADNKTRVALTKAIQARDEKAMQQATKQVNDSMTAKKKADQQRAARAKAAAERAARAKAQATARATTSSGTGSYSSTNRWGSSSYSSGSSRTYSGYSSGSYSGRSGSSGGSSSSTHKSSGSTTHSGGTSNKGGTYKPTKPGDTIFGPATHNQSCSSGGFCPIG